MKHVPFSEVLKNASVDIKREYERLFAMFFIQQIPQIGTLRDLCAKNFINIPFRGTCLSLDDFDDFYGYGFEQLPSMFGVDYLINFCEYSYNLVLYCQMGFSYMPVMGTISPQQLYINQVLKVIELIGYTEYQQGEIINFVPKKQEVIMASESVDDEIISVDILQYNHHSMNGNIEEKRRVLTSFANYFEQKRKDIESFNKKFSDNLFFMFNNFNIRHDNNGNNSLLEDISGENLEEYYDITYELCLTAFSILSGNESNDKVKNIRRQLGK